MEMTISYQNRKGLLAPCTSIAPPVINGVRMTPKARKALKKAGHKVKAENADLKTFSVTLCGRRMPRLCVEIRLVDCLEYPCIHVPNDRYFSLWRSGCWDGQSWQNIWRDAEWMTCPRCKAPITWYEAGFVPGYRICLGNAHHHLILK